MLAKGPITIGRTVRYHPTESESVVLGGRELPAVIVARTQGSSAVNLRIIPNNQVDERWKENVPHGGKQGQWSWPAEFGEN